MSVKIITSPEVAKFIAERGPATYHLWAEHTQGKSISHPCTRGVWDDPTEGWSMEIEAANEEEALNKGWAAFTEYMGDDLTEPCNCQRRVQAGYDSWWESVILTASLESYPNYVGDEDQAREAGVDC